MKDLIPVPAVIRNDTVAVQALFSKYVVPSYARFEIALSHGAGSYVWDVTGKRYLDLGGGIAVNALGHAHPEITEALIEQSRKLVHISNLYFQEPQGRLAASLVERIGPGKVFFCNSGAEANEGLFKVARRYGNPDGRFEIITCLNSFHGRTLAGIAATGQDKVKKGFDPLTPGFCHVSFNDIGAVRDAITPATVAVLIEGIQGEGGITAATPEYLLGLRRLCDEQNLLLLMDGVQCGHYRTGRFQSFQRALENEPTGTQFLPDGIAMAKSLGGGFPMGAFWVRQKHGDLLGPGSHGTTYGGTPLGCTVASRILGVIERDRLADNVRTVGDFLLARLRTLTENYPSVLESVRGVGFMIGLQLKENIQAFQTQDKPASLQMVVRLHQAGLLTIPSGTSVIRLLPPLNLTQHEANEGLELLENVVRDLAASRS